MLFIRRCSHGTKGACQTFTCKFHGWTYALDGSLRHITDEHNFFGLKKETLGMTPVSVDTWEGFIFINVNPDPSQTLAGVLGGRTANKHHRVPF